MPVIRQNAPARLGLKLESGFDYEKAQPIMKTVSFGNISATIDDEALYAAATALASLSRYPLRAVTRTDSATLQN